MGRLSSECGLCGSPLPVSVYSCANLDHFLLLGVDAERAGSAARRLLMHGSMLGSESRHVAFALLHTHSFAFPFMRGCGLRNNVTKGNS
jgi:hypothetical protein